MNFKCLIDGKVMNVAEISNKQLKAEFEKGQQLLTKRIPELSSSSQQNANVIAYIENGTLRYRFSLQTNNLINQ